MKPEINALDLVTLKLIPGKWDMICTRLKADGYEETPDGLSKFILDLFEGQEDDEDETEAVSPMKQAMDYIQKNPEKIAGILGGVKGMAAETLVRYFRRRKA